MYEMMPLLYPPESSFHNYIFRSFVLLNTKCINSIEALVCVTSGTTFPMTHPAPCFAANRFLRKPTRLLKKFIFAWLVLLLFPRLAFRIHFTLPIIITFIHHLTMIEQAAARASGDIYCRVLPEVFDFDQLFLETSDHHLHSRSHPFQPHSQGSVDNMTESLTSTVEEHQTVSWPLRSFAIDKDSQLAGPADLFLDRANGEFGFIRYTSLAVATVVQFPDTSEPVFFQVNGARAAAWRPKSRKISILFQYLQIDLEFNLPEHARGFLCVLQDLILAAGNHFFSSYEVPT